MTVNTLAILTAVEECCLGAIGTGETVAAGTVDRGAYQPLDDDRLAAFVRTQPRIEVEFKGERDTGLLPRMSSHASVEVRLLVRLVYPTEFELQANERRALRATAWATGNAIRNALTHGPNLLTTSAAVPTELLNGQLKKVEVNALREDFKRRLWVAELPCVGLVCTSRAG